MSHEHISKFISLLQKSPNEGGCWNWLGSTDMRGYGYFNFNGKSVRAHRFSYEFFKGKIPPRKVIDHLCMNPSCVNPEHLECVSHYENIMRGNGVGATGSRKTVCPKGHPYAGDNLREYKAKTGRVWRLCKICQRQHMRNWRKKKKEKQS